VIESYPTSPGSGSVRIIIFKDTTCAQQTNGFMQNNFVCYFSVFTIPDVTFTCGDTVNDYQPTSTAAITASRIAGLAANSSEWLSSNK
jgi:hypothetical protein